MWPIHVQTFHYEPCTPICTRKSVAKINTFLITLSVIFRHHRIRTVAVELSLPVLNDRLPKIVKIWLTSYGGDS